MSKLFKYEVKTCQVIYALINNKEITYYLLEFKKTKKGVQVMSKKEFNIQSIQTKTIDKSLPCLLVIDGKSILHKQVSDIEIDLEKIFKNHYGTSSFNEFYSQLYSTGAKEKYLSIIRRNTIDEIISPFEKMGVFLVEIFVGPFILEKISSLLSAILENEDMDIPGFTIKKNGDHIQFLKNSHPNDSTSTQVISFHGEQMQVYEIICFAAGVVYLTHSPPETIKTENTFVLESITNIAFKNKLKLISVPLLFFIFMVLLINFFVFNDYSNKLNKFQSLYNIHETKIKDLELMNREIEDKKKLITELGLNSKIPLSYYADRLATEIPPGLKLTKLEINPKQTEEDDKVEFEKNVIHINGTCMNAVDLNTWVKKIEKYWWLKKTAYIDLKNKTNGNTPSFIVKVLY
jgi:Tfp pilus assembly protein PilN